MSRGGGRVRARACGCGSGLACDAWLVTLRVPVRPVLFPGLVLSNVVVVVEDTEKKKIEVWGRGGTSGN